jgi:hypothetical protein
LYSLDFSIFPHTAKLSKPDSQGFFQQGGKKPAKNKGFPESKVLLTLAVSQNLNQGDKHG